MARSGPAAVRTDNAEGASPFVFVCDHASNRIPDDYDALGLTLDERLMHIAWDPGALAVCNRLVDTLDAPLVRSTVSRLVIDCNRAPEAPDLIVPVSERTSVPGNARVSETDRQQRLASFHAPFHRAVEDLLNARLAEGRETILVCMHSFTPIYKDVPRRWPIGLIHGTNQGFTAALRDALLADAPALDIGWNEPYAALTGVTYTLEHHGDGRGLEATMIEIRNNEILDPGGVQLWADRLARCLMAARQARLGTPTVAAEDVGALGGTNG